MGSKKILALGFAILMVFSSVLVNRVVVADSELNLPSTIVWIEVSNGTESYFSTVLSDVPSGYDVANGAYVGWCVDRTADMERSPTKHAVTLYSSTSPLGELASEKWDMVNYILNHKQGTREDIQQAIWYFINMVGNYTPTSPIAIAIVNDAIANGNGFVPSNGQIVAVICYPEALLPDGPVQISIIEITTPVISEFSSFLILPMFMLATLLLVLAFKRSKVRRVY